jgi:protein-S-isoprenylcysteine O-methyltransferase Ste14
MESNAETSPDGQKMTATQWAGVVLVYLLIPLILFVCNGSLTWWQGWGFSILIFLAGVGPRVGVEIRFPGLMTERMKFGKGRTVMGWDRVLAPLMAISISFPLVIVAGLDHRYGWTAAFPLWVNLLGLALILVGYAISSWAMLENRYFSSEVYIQMDRGHRVCDTGPYRYVRHPSYAGNAVAMIGIVLALNSLWTIISVVFALLVTLIRTALEDRALARALPGYQEYARQVLYRLVPGIW